MLLVSVHVDRDVMMVADGLNVLLGLYFAAKRGVVARTSRPWLFKLMDALEMARLFHFKSFIRAD